MSEIDPKKQHAEIMALWERYKALHKTLLILQADMSRLDEDIRACGKSLYELYKISSAGLNGDLPEKS